MEENTKFKKTNSNIILETISFLLLLILWIIPIYFFSSLPEEIPMHYTQAKVDSYGSKWTIFYLPIFGLILFVTLTLLSKTKYVGNITEIKKTSIISKIFMLLIFLVINYSTIEISTGIKKALDLSFLPFLVIFYLLIMVAIKYNTKKELI